MYGTYLFSLLIYLSVLYSLAVSTATRLSEQAVAKAAQGKQANSSFKN